MFVVLSNHVCLVKIYIFYFLLMFIVKTTWVYFLNFFFNVFSCFKKFKALVEKESDYSIKSLRMDRRWFFFLMILISFVKIMI